MSSAKSVRILALALSALLFAQNTTPAHAQALTKASAPNENQKSWFISLRVFGQAGAPNLAAVESIGSAFQDPKMAFHRRNYQIQNLLVTDQNYRQAAGLSTENWEQVYTSWVKQNLDNKGVSQSWKQHVLAKLDAESNVSLLAAYQQITTLPGLSDLDAQEKRALLVHLSRQKIIYSATENDVRESLSEAKSILNSEEKVLLTRQMGELFLRNYDTDRQAGRGDQATGVVPLLTVLQGVKSVTPEGVCRDISSAQAQIMEGLGFRDVYILGYGSTAPHAVVIARDPDKMNEMIKIDYYHSRTTSLAAGSQAIQPTDDFGTNYTISLPAGRTVASLPTDLAALLNDALRIDTKEIDPFYIKNYTALQALDGGWKGLRGTQFYGRMNDGRIIVGASGSYSWDNSFHRGGVYASFFQQNSAVNQLSIYEGDLRIFERIQTPHIRLSSTVKAQGFTRSYFSASKGPVVYQDPMVASDNFYWGSANQSFGAEAKYEHPEGKREVKLKVEQDFFVGLRDIRSGDVKDVRLERNWLAATVEGRESLSDKVDFNYEATVGHRYFGDQYKLAAGVSSKSGNEMVMLSYYDRIQQDIPQFVPGALRQVQLTAGMKLKGFEFEASFRQPLELDLRANQLLISAKKTIGTVNPKKRKKPQT